MSKRLLSDNFGNWLAGFIDGEGSFYIHKRGDSFWVPLFSLKLRDDDYNILVEIARRTGLGNVVRIRRSDRSRPQAKWVIYRRADCLSLIKLLERFPLRAKKKRDFLIWREAVLLWSKQRKIGIAGGGNLKYSGSDKMKGLYLELKDIRTYKDLI